MLNSILHDSLELTEEEKEEKGKYNEEDGKCGFALELLHEMEILAQCIVDDNAGSIVDDVKYNGDKEISVGGNVYPSQVHTNEECSENLHGVEVYQSEDERGDDDGPWCETL